MKPHKQLFPSRNWDNDSPNEFAQIVEAIPAPFRPAIVKAALTFDPSSSFERSDVVGIVRVALAAVLEPRRCTHWLHRWKWHARRDAAELNGKLDQLSSAHSAVAVREQLTELLLNEWREIDAAD